MPSPKLFPSQGAERSLRTIRPPPVRFALAEDPAADAAVGKPLIKAGLADPASAGGGPFAPRDTAAAAGADKGLRSQAGAADGPAL